jgi:hypothetical protein
VQDTVIEADAVFFALNAVVIVAGLIDVASTG